MAEQNSIPASWLVLCGTEMVEVTSQGQYHSGSRQRAAKPSTVCPWAPETFKEELERPAEKVERTYKAAKLDDYYRDDNKKFFYKFTHRDDFDSVMESYRKAFVAKARGIPVLEFSRLPAEEVRILARALPYYENLETIKLADRSIVNEEGAKNS